MIYRRVFALEFDTAFGSELINPDLNIFSSLNAKTATESDGRRKGEAPGSEGSVAGKNVSHRMIGIEKSCYEKSNQRCETIEPS